MPAEPLISLIDISRRYQMGEVTVDALRGMTLDRKSYA